jgi:hypothetical protein
MLAKDLKAGQKFTYGGNDEECTAIGVIDYCDDVYFTETWGSGICVNYIGSSQEVTLVEEKPAPVDPGEGYRLLGPDEIIEDGDDYHSSIGSTWIKCRGLIGCRADSYEIKAVRRKVAEPVKPTYRPYTAEEAAAIVGKVVVLKEDPNCKAVVTCSSPDDNSVYCGPIQESVEELLREFTFLDGSPCGVAE